MNLRSYDSSAQGKRGYSELSFLLWFLLPSSLLPGDPVAKNPPANSGFNPWVGKIPWRREMVTHPSILAWEIPWTEEPGGL